MTQRLAGKVAVVTGASKGIGAAIAQQLAADGARVVVNYASSAAAAKEVVAGITAKKGTAVAIQADISVPADIERLFAETKKVYGGLDILVNNAGIYEFAPLGDVTVEHYKKMFDLNVLGLILSTKAALPLFGKNGGSVINISSLVAAHGLPMISVYSGTKGAVDAITRALAQELGPNGIRVNAVNPGMVATEGTAAVGIDDGEMREMYEDQAPLGRIGKPGDIAPLVAFLASDDAAWITGATHHANGGFR